MAKHTLILTAFQSFHTKNNFHKKNIKINLIGTLAITLKLELLRHSQSASHLLTGAAKVS